MENQSLLQDNGDTQGDRPETLPHIAPCNDVTTERVQPQQVSDTVSFVPIDIKTDIKVMSSMHHASYAKLIDNSRINYVAIKLRCGVIAMCRTNVLTLCPSALKCLNQDLTMCLEIMPPSVHAFVRRTRFWVNLSYSYGARDDPRLLQHTTAHHHQAWLLWARDRPDKVNSIEIYDCRDYQRMRLHWNGPGLIIHELSHLIHQHCLDDGLRNLRVLQAYIAARNSRLYDNTLRRDWAGEECDHDLAYAMVDHKEFFAEMSVSYLCDSYHELDDEDKTSMERCCPPCVEPTVVKRLHQKRRKVTLSGAKVEAHGIPQRQISSNGKSETKGKDDRCPLKALRFVAQCCKPKVEIMPARPLPHCNKFYPFTRGQLKKHDTATYRVMSELWHEIELWDDPYDDRLCGKGFALRVPFLRQSKFQSDIS